MTNPLLDRLRHHVTGAIERGEATAITEIREFEVTVVQMVRESKTYTVQAGTEDEARDIALHTAIESDDEGINSDDFDEVSERWTEVNGKMEYEQ